MVRPSRRAVGPLLGLTVLLAATGNASAQTDPLPSWNDGATRQAIVAFVKDTTTPGSPWFDRGSRRRVFLLVPAQAFVSRYIQSLVEFPPRQRPDSFNLQGRARQADLAPAGRELMRIDVSKKRGGRTCSPEGH